MEQEFSKDIYHSLVLAHYIAHWGMPKERIISERTGFNEQIIIYYFPGIEPHKIARIATIGLSQQSRSNGTVQCEYIMILPHDLGGASLKSVFHYILDISANTVMTTTNVAPPRISGKNTLAPNEWETKALLFDELRGEDELFSHIPYHDLFNTQFIWVVPIYESEFQLIMEKGIEYFDKLEQAAEFSLVDVTRKAFC